MSLTATIYPISAAAYEAGRGGDLANFEPDVASGISLDKAWHAIHHLATGDDTLNLPAFRKHTEQHSYCA